MKNLILTSFLFLLLKLGIAQVPSAEYLTRIHNVTTTQMVSITNVDTGSLIYNLDSLQLFQYNGTTWKAIDFTKIRSITSSKDTLFVTAGDSTYSTRLTLDLDSFTGTVFPIWAERSSALSTTSSSGFQWAYGNGDNSQAGFGINVPIDCEIFAVGLTLFDGTAEVEVYINGVATGKKSGSASAGPSNAALTQLDTSIKLQAGDVVNFRTTAASGANSGGKAVAWLKKIVKIPNYTRHNGSGLPANSLGDDLDEYLDIVTGNLYTKESGSWVFKINIKGPTGSTSNRAYIQLSNTLSTNINNASITNFTWLDTTTANTIQDTSSIFSKDTDGVIVNQTGLYKVTVFQFQTTTVQRSNTAVRIAVGGTTQAGYGANAYVRNASPHVSSTASFSRLVSVSAGQKIAIQNETLASTGTVTCPAGSLIFLIEQI